MKYLKHLLVMSFTVMVSLSGCSNEADISEKSSTQVSSVLEQTLSDASIEDELSYIETLVGVEEFSAAKLALETLESNLTQPIDNEELSARLMTLKQSLSEVEVSEKECHDHAFTGADAVAIAVERYGADDDIVYMYDENHEHYADNQIGYYVALKSKSLQEQEGGDGIILMLFVGEDGSITEL